MTHRFERNRKSSYLRNIIISLSFFLAVLLCFYLSVMSVSSESDKEEYQTLETALTRSITQCYAVEGNYPESLDYLKKSYGLHYDEEKFFVDYQPLGSNIIPDVTIIKKEE